MSEERIKELRAELAALTAEKEQRRQAAEEAKRKQQEDEDNQWALDRLPTDPGMYIVVWAETPNCTYQVYWLDENGRWCGDNPQWYSIVDEETLPPSCIVSRGWPIVGIYRVNDAEFQGRDSWEAYPGWRSQ